jgi:NhaP-type Na+/H+ or K+/H+ antiporter
MIRALLDRVRSPMVRALFPGVPLTAVGVGAFVAVLNQFLEKDDLYFVD